MSDSTEERTSGDPPLERDFPDAEKHPGSTRIAVTAFGFIVCLGLAAYIMRAITPGATLVVEVAEDDELANIVLDTNVVKIREVDGTMVHVLRPGRLSVRAGEYHIDAEVKGVRLEFSTGETFEIKKDQVLKMVIRGFPEEDSAEE